MAKKKVAVAKEDLALARKAVENLEDQNISLMRSNQELREQLAELEAAGGPPMVRLVTDGSPISTRALIAKALGIDVPPGAEVADEVILDVVQRLRGPTDDGEEGAMVKRNESLAEAVAANKAQRDELDDRLTSSKNIVNRLAATLGVDRWGSDGEEILEKAQRFSTFHYWLKKQLASAPDRISTHFAQIAREADREQIAEFVAQEFRTIIAALVGEAQLAKLIQNKGIKVSKTVLDLAENQPPASSWTFEHNDLHKIEHALSMVADETERSGHGDGDLRVNTLANLFLQLKSAGVSSDLVAFMNTAVLPAISRLQLLTKAG